MSGGGPTPDTSDSTSSSLLDRVKAHDPDAWRRLSALYSPLVYGWCRHVDLDPNDAADIIQEVFRAVAVNIQGFRRNRPGDTFQGWLWAIARNKIHDHWRGRAARPDAAGGTDAYVRLQQLPDTPPDERTDSASTAATQLSRRALELVRIEFEERTLQAFWRVAVDGCAPADVAAELGMSKWAVYKAKSRVLGRLREELGDLMD